MLKVKNIVAGYSEVSVLEGVSLEVKEGSVVSLVGANATGKTTLVNSICGLLPIKEGTVEYKGEEISFLKPYERVYKGLVQVPEGRKLFPEMNVHDNLLVSSSFTSAKRKRKESLEFVYTLFPRLKEREDQIASTMSGGEQQMLAIGRALMSSPQLLILDEPSLGLAPKIVKEIFKVIEKLRKSGLTVLIIEQNVKHALELCDYAYIMEHGKIVLEGTGNDLLNNSQTIDIYLGRK